MQHPIKSNFLIRINSKEQALYTWNNLEIFDEGATGTRSLEETTSFLDESLDFDKPLGSPLARTPLRTAEILNP